MAYGSAPLRFSDHRPVYAVFHCNVNIVDEERRLSISEALYKKRKAEIGDTTSILDEESSDDEDLIGYDAIEPGLPPASSDRQKWWLAHGQPARVGMTPPAGGNDVSSVLNPSRPANPFSLTDEPDWVSVPRSSSRQSQSSMASSAYEMVNNPAALSTSAGTPAPRRLPPPYDAASLPAKVGRANAPDEANKPPARETPPPPLPRRQASTPASQVAPAGHKPLQNARTAPPPPPSRVTPGAQKTPAPIVAEGKPSAPPIARKPLYLASAPPSQAASAAPTVGATREEEGTGSKPPLPIRSSTGGGAPTSLPGASGSVGGKSGAPPKPPKPAGVAVTGSTIARKPAPQVPAKKDGAVDLLDSLEGDGGAGIGGWETLKPTG